MSLAAPRAESFAAAAVSCTDSMPPPCAPADQRLSRRSTKPLPSSPSWSCDLLLDRSSHASERSRITARSASFTKDTWSGSRLGLRLGLGLGLGFG